jgi:SlyX protein
MTAMPVPDANLEFQFDRRFAELETRLAFQEHSLAEMSDALAESRAENARTQELLRRALEDLRTLRTLLYSDPGTEPPPPHY